MRTAMPIFAGVFWIILGGLVLRNFNGANELLKTGFSGSNTLIGTLEQK